MSLIRKGILAGGGSVVCVGLGVVTNMMLARSLLPEGMGRYQLPMTMGALIVTVLSLGIGQANIYFLNKHKIEPKKIVMNSIWAALAGSVILMLIVPVIFTVFANYFGQLRLWVKIVFSAGACGLLTVALLRPVLTAALQVRQAVSVQVTQAVTILAIVAFCFIFKLMSVNLALNAFAMSHLVSLAVLLYFVSDRIDFSIFFSWRLFLQTLHYGLKLYAGNIVYLINVSIGLMLLRYLMPDDFGNVGYYGRAVAICKLVMLLPIAVGPLLYAQWAAFSGDERRLQAQLAMRLHLLLGIVTAFSIGLFGHWLILLLYGKQFLAALSALRILIVGTALMSMLNVCISLLASDGRAHITAYMMTFGVAAQIVLMWILVPRLGINGAALANTASNCLVFSAGIIILKHGYQVSLRHIILLKRSDLVYLMNAIYNRRVSEKQISNEQ